MKTFTCAVTTLIASLPFHVIASTISVTPDIYISGDPIMITIEATTTVQSVLVEGKKVPLFKYLGRSTALFGIGLNESPGDRLISVKLSNGESIYKKVNIKQRKVINTDFEVPVRLGGNGTTSVKKLISTLEAENKSLLNLRTGTHIFWLEGFMYPLSEATITDEYGYQRQTGGYAISHKGVDFRASEGTPVLAMNRGVVRLVQTGRNYGKTVVIDHGLGVQTLYMHLSKINVNEGQLVLPHEVIGLSGKTGYAEYPHLHLSVRIGEKSIDPIKFLELFNK